LHLFQRNGTLSVAMKRAAHPRDAWRRIRCAKLHTPIGEECYADFMAWFDPQVLKHGLAKRDLSFGGNR
jgi:hypothetical protein